MSRGKDRHLRDGREGGRWREVGAHALVVHHYIRKFADSFGKLLSATALPRDALYPTLIEYVVIWGEEALAHQPSRLGPFTKERAEMKSLVVLVPDLTGAMSACIRS